MIENLKNKITKNNKEQITVEFLYKILVYLVARVSDTSHEDLLKMTPGQILDFIELGLWRGDKKFSKRAIQKKRMD